MDQLSWLVYLYQEQNIYFVQCRHVPWILYWIKHALEKRANEILLLFSSTTKWWDSSQSQWTGQCLSSVWLTVIMHSVRQLLRLNHEVGLSDEVPWVQLQVLWPVFDDIHRLNYLKNLCYSIIIWEISNWLSDCNWQWSCYIIIFVCMWLSAAIRITHVAI